MQNKLTIRLTPFNESSKYVPPQVSAFSWSLHSLSSGQELSSKSNYERLEIASLTKIMTAYVAIQIAETMERDPEIIFITVPPYLIKGTSAQLRPGDLLTLNDLLYGMLLPSGNDAAVAIANWGGEQVELFVSDKMTSQFVITRTDQEVEVEAQKEQLLQSPRLTWTTIMRMFQEDTQLIRVLHQRTNFIIDEIQKQFQDADFYLNLSRFVKEMNFICQKLGMRDTQFSNAHGLASKANKSTAYDMCRLCTFFVRNQLLRKIVRTKHYSKQTYKTLYEWHNTNLLLNNPRCRGLKTGFTPNAGACLAVLYNLNGKNDSDDLGDCVILVLLGAKDQFRRFSEAEKLLQWSEIKWGNGPRKPRSAAESSDSIEKKKIRLKSAVLRIRRTGSKYQ